MWLHRRRRIAATADADFYKGRNVTVVVSSSAAGGYDTVARAVARHIGRHMPGNPAVIVRNMPGAGGMTATNFLYNNADKDGSVIGLVQNNTPFEPLLGTKEARYDPVKFNWLGTPSVETAMVLLWHAVPVNSIEELRVREVDGRRVRRQFDASLLRPAVECDARHEVEADQRLSRAERGAAGHGAARARRPSQRILQLGAVHAPQLAARRNREGDRAIWVGADRASSVTFRSPPISSATRRTGW